MNTWLTNRSLYKNALLTVYKKHNKKKTHHARVGVGFN